MVVVAVAVAAPAGARCRAPENRQFDFWLGEWDVTNLANGKTTAVNKITSIHQGCALYEDYVNGPYSGSSLNFYDKTTSKWNQTWIDHQGAGLFLSGGLEDGKMVMSSDPDVKPVQRITWTPNEDGSVRQHWQTSKDGKEWTTAFDSLYKKQGQAATE